MKTKNGLIKPPQHPVWKNPYFPCWVAWGMGQQFSQFSMGPLNIWIYLLWFNPFLHQCNLVLHSTKIPFPNSPRKAINLYDLRLKKEHYHVGIIIFTLVIIWQHAMMMPSWNFICSKATSQSGLDIPLLDGGQGSMLCYQTLLLQTCIPHYYMMLNLMGY